MCLACEMDALWFAEMEAAGATPGTAGVPPALQNYSASLTPGSPERAGETPAVPGGVPPSVPSRFRCEETGS
jgi:hypothetical protein